jgi:diguanylate cyclase (GGDEF)-like protein
MKLRFGPRGLGERIARYRQKLVEAPMDSGVSDVVLRRLVATVLLARTALYTSTMLGFLVNVLAWAMTGKRIFWVYFAVNAAIGFVRAWLSAGYARLDFETIDRRRLLAHERIFLVWSTLFALNIGLTCFSLLNIPDDNVQPLAITVCVGYSVAFMTRASGRLSLALAQILALMAAPVGLLLTSDRPHALTYSVLCGAAVAASIAMAYASHRRSVALCVADEENQRMARRDMLTGLPNRYAFAEALGVALRRPGYLGRPFAVMTIDIDHFKDINDTLGHSVGDAVIVTLAERLAAAIDPADFVARLGGDEFVVLAFDCPSDHADLRIEADRITAALSAPIVQDGETLTMNASIGVALYPEHGTTTDELMQRADIALYEAKRNRGRQSCVFDAAMQARLTERRYLEAQIALAIQGDQFEPWYQPIKNIETGEFIGYEALARWRHPELGLIPPARFIPTAEHADMISAIGRSMLNKACRDAARWPPHLTVSVNLSSVEFHRPTEVLASIARALQASGLPPQRLYIEITESLLLDDSAETRRAIGELIQLGVRISLDDFGTGYSSLSYIQDFPISTIKIDKKFVDRIATDRKSSAIVAAIVALADGLGMEVVAEGVETIVQEIALKRLGITHAQGYLYGKPAPDALSMEGARLAS